MSSDLTFITNEQGKHLGDRFGVLLGDDTRLFDCLVGYFFISRFHKLHPALTKTEKIRILVGIKTDRKTYELIQTAKDQQEFVLESHAHVRELLPGEILAEFQKSGDSSQIEEGVRKFVEWIKSGKLEVRAYPSERVHAKLYIMTFHEGDRDKGRVITGSSNFTEAGLQENLEFNVELKNRSDYDFALQKFNELWAKSVDVTKDYVTTIEVKSPFAQSRELWLIYVPWHFPLHEDTTITSASPKAEREFQKLYPAIYKHLERFKDELADRDKAETGIRHEWYAMARPRFEIHTAFEQPKIILGRFMNKPTYAFDTEGFYHNDAQYLIGGANPYLVAILNSSVCWWFLTQICTDLQNGYLQALIEYQVQIPIPTVPTEKQNPVERLVERILSAKQHDAGADVSALEREIDELVYALYGLTPQEIKLVEEAGPA